MDTRSEGLGVRMGLATRQCPRHCWPFKCLQDWHTGRHSVGSPGWTCRVGTKGRLAWRGRWCRRGWRASHAREGLGCVPLPGLPSLHPDCRRVWPQGCRGLGPGRRAGAAPSLALPSCEETCAQGSGTFLGSALVGDLGNPALPAGPSLRVARPLPGHLPAPGAWPCAGAPAGRGQVPGASYGAAQPVSPAQAPSWVLGCCLQVREVAWS